MVWKAAPGQSAPSSSTIQVRWEEFAVSVGVARATSPELGSRSSKAYADGGMSVQERANVIEHVRCFRCIIKNRVDWSWRVINRTLAPSIKNANGIELFGGVAEGRGQSHSRNMERGKPCKDGADGAVII